MVAGNKEKYVLVRILLIMMLPSCSDLEKQDKCSQFWWVDVAMLS